MLLTLAAASSAGAASAAVYAYPIPGARVASPNTQITFRGAPVGQLGTISVIGSRSGAHPGRLLADSDGDGGSFLPTRPFASGERVTVTAGVPIVGGTGDRYQFITAKPAPSLGFMPVLLSPRVRGDVQHFQSRPDLQPAAIKILKRSSAAAAGDIFLGPQGGPIQNGPMLIDPVGRLIWFKPLPRNTFATDFRVQTLGGSSVLTWWQGNVSFGVGNGRDVIYDSSYRQLYSLAAGNGLRADLHEFQLTPQGTALITAYYPVLWDARSVHSSSNQVVLDAVVQELDLKTGLVLYQWDSLDHVPLTDSYATRARSAKQPYDYFHINAIQQDTDGNLVVSGRDTWAGYKIDHHTGAMIWILGGRHSTFKLGAGVQFAWQHDIRVRSPRIVTLFDDGAGDSVFHHQSRGLTLSLDFVHHTATRVAAYQHVPSLLAFYEGNMQALSNGDYMIGWGQQPYFSEYDQRGKLVFDGRFVDANSHYRAYRFPWSGTPTTRPAVAAHTSGHNTTVYASWNGATGVSSWRILGGPSATALKTLRTTATQGFETHTVISAQTYLSAQALDRSGRVMGQSLVVRPR